VDSMYEEIEIIVVVINVSIIRSIDVSRTHHLSHILYC
jgi:hypothetical protein